MQAISKQFAIARVHPDPNRPVQYRTGTSVDSSWTNEINRALIVKVPKTLKAATSRERNSIKKRIDYHIKNPNVIWGRPYQDDYIPYEYLLVEVDVTYDLDVQKGLKL